MPTFTGIVEAKSDDGAIHVATRVQVIGDAATPEMFEEEARRARANAALLANAAAGAQRATQRATRRARRDLALCAGVGLLQLYLASRHASEAADAWAWLSLSLFFLYLVIFALSQGAALSARRLLRRVLDDLRDDGLVVTGGERSHEPLRRLLP